MNDMERPDLSNASAEVVAYIHALEAELERLRDRAAAEPDEPAPPTFDPSEAPTTQNVITITAGGLAKRTPRHLYDRQRRGGMGIFDIEAPLDDPPLALTVADEGQNVLLLTDRARGFIWPVSRLPEVPVRGRGQSLAEALPLQPGERLAVVLPAGRGTGIALLSETGFVRVLPAHVAGHSLNPGTPLYRASEYGPLVGACWTSGAGDLFIATRRGAAIRFPERAVPLGGTTGIRLEAGDRAVAVEAVLPSESDSLFLIAADGLGTIRRMAGFAANKSPGGGGKLALRTDSLIGVLAVQPADDIFAISRLSKIIRFRAEEVPAKDGVVQGVHCMALRADEVVAVTTTGISEQ